MADSISLTISSNGVNLAGDHTATSLGRANTIEALVFEQPVFIGFDRATYRPGTRRFYAPVKFTKRLDRSTPLLRKALVNNEVVAGNFRWFRPDPAGTGATEHMFTLSFTQGRVTRCTLLLPDVLQPATATLPAMETVELTLGSIVWTWIPGSVEFEDLDVVDT